MDKTEFDRFAEEYERLHRENISVSGEQPEFFAEYKIADLRRVCGGIGLEPRLILDFGCGIGASTPFLRQYFPDSEIISADVSQKSLDILSRRYSGLSRSVRIDGVDLPFDDHSLDIAFTSCVFHHISEREHQHWLGEIRRVVRPGGVFMLFEHNPWNPLTVRAVNTCPFDEHAVLIDAPKMAARLRSAGWSSVAVRYRLFFPAPLAFLRPLEKFLTWLPLGAQYYLFAKA